MGLRQRTGLVTLVFTDIVDSWDATARIWEIPSGRPLTPWMVGHRSGVSFLEFFPDGRTLMTASDADHTFRFWHATTGTEILGSRLMLLPQIQSTFGSDNSVFITGNSADPPSILLTALPSLTEIDSQMKTRRLVRVRLAEP